MCHRVHLQRLLHALETILARQRLLEKHWRLKYVHLVVHTEEDTQAWYIAESRQS